jgi:asparagine synthase (glutamine-hydrolysing)
MWEHLPETMLYLDVPIGDPLTVPNLLVGKLARENLQTTLKGVGNPKDQKNQTILIKILYGAINNQDSLQEDLIAFQKCALDVPQFLGI